MASTIHPFLLGLVLLSVLTTGHTYRSPFSIQFPRKTLQMTDNGVDPGKPLFLTPYIRDGNITEGRKLAKVSPLQGTSLKMYSGFLTVNETYSSNMFFWYIPAQQNPEDAPLLLWLQGGPGGTSLFGLFVENGPFGVDKNLKLVTRKFAWTSKYSMLYIDNPVGTGFSFTKSDAGYATNQAEVAENLYSALSQFFTLFPTSQKVDFYITGESYAGKYIPAIAHWIHNQNTKKIKNFKGIAIGDGFTDPPTMLPQYADFMYSIGSLDANQRDYFKVQCNKVVWMMDHGRWMDAFRILDLLLSGHLSGVPSYYTNVTGCTYYYNYMRCKMPKDQDYYSAYVSLPAVRKSIHVGDLPFNSGEKVETFLVKDILQSVKPWLGETMDNYRVMLYTGQLDVIVALPLTEAMLQTVAWSGLDQYQHTKRKVWRVQPDDTEVAGYVRNVKSFYQVLVRGGGHILPYDQPERSFDMIDRFITDRPFS
ncbi:putative serine carboxypeptidase CPVL [Lamellibrachia satsuma]|nr:putative serine carboxypeptidase CPVL [Lamellibrachia satsuma]